eukprot:m.47695 g.47695  ORF g.47695 m.47695 type:complete len:512 (+) comp12345_c0_seq1:206-1741(+)
MGRETRAVCLCLLLAVVFTRAASLNNTFQLCAGSSYRTLCSCIDGVLNRLSTPADNLPRLESLPDGATLMRPSGTVCSDGSPWVFTLDKVDTSKLFLDFSGGGACWSAETCFESVLCSPPLSSNCKGSYFRTLTPDASTLAAIECGLDISAYAEDYFGGFLARQNEDNAFATWSHVFIPYCTGDIHLGNNTHVYSGCQSNENGCVVHHRGSVNAMKVVDWVIREFIDTEILTDLVCFGDSAGAYASSVYCSILAEAIAQRGLNVRTTLLADSGIGLAAVSPTWTIEQGALAEVRRLSQKQHLVFKDRVFGLHNGFYTNFVPYRPQATYLQPGARIVQESVRAFATAFPHARASILTCNNDENQRLFMQYTYQDYGCHCCLDTVCNAPNVCLSGADMFTQQCNEDCSTGCFTNRWAEEAPSVIRNLTDLPNFAPFFAPCDYHTFVRSSRFYETAGSMDLDNPTGKFIAADFAAWLVDYSCSDVQICSSGSHVKPLSLFITTCLFAVAWLFAL